MMPALTDRSGMRAPQMAPPAAAASADARSAPMRQVSITPTGGRRMRFTGREVAVASSQGAGRTPWHEVTIYMRQTGGAVLSIHVACDAPGDRTRVAAWRLDGVSAAIERLAEYDAGADVAPPPEPDDGAASPAEIAAAALGLRAQVALARRDFGALRSEIHEHLAAAGLV